MALPSVPNQCSNVAPRLKWRPGGDIEGACEEDNFGHYCSTTASQRERLPGASPEAEHQICPNVTCHNSPVSPSSPPRLSPFSTLSYRFYVSFYIAPFYHVLLFFYRCLPGFLLLHTSYYPLFSSLRSSQHLQNVSCGAKDTPLGAISRWARTLGSAHRGSLPSLRRSLLHSPHSMGFIKWLLSLVIMLLLGLQTGITAAQHAKQVRAVLVKPFTFGYKL